MTLECCGQPCSTKYCPHCGTHLSGSASSLSGLLRHICSAIAAQKANLKNIDPNDASYGRRERSLSKWGSWKVDLEALIEKADHEKV